MVYLDIKYRYFLLYDFKLGFKASESAKRINGVFGENVVKQRTAQFWFQRFKSGKESVEDEQRSGGPMKLNDDELLRQLSQNPTASCLELSKELNCNQESIRIRLKSLGYAKKLDKWIPHVLSVQNIQARLSICSSLLARHNVEPFLDKILTVDEKWVYHNNSKRMSRWQLKGSKPGMSPKQEIHPKKLLMSVWWTSRGIVHVEFLKANQTINGKVYCDQIRRAYSKLSKMQPSLVNRKGVLLLQDNARPHTSKLAQETLKELKIETLPHPPYSPDISPCDYYLFSCLSNFQRNKTYDSDDSLKNDIVNFFNSKNSDFYRTGIYKLVNNWQKIVDSDGNYFV